MRIACLPIDSRPCNTQFIESLVSWTGSEAIFPRPDEMDDFRAPANYEANLAFLSRELPRCDAAVISLDHWCYGSLLASREDDVSKEEALRRVRELSDLLGRYPHKPVYMSSVILRSSISAFSVNDLDAYNAMTEYSIAWDRFEQFGAEEDKKKMDAASGRIPEAVLKKALWARERNLAVNLAAIDLAKAGSVKALSILQEDSQPFGLPKKDQREIMQRMRAAGVTNVFLRNGTDEAGALSAAEALWAGNPPLPVEIIYLGKGDFTAPYEDRPFRENMESACREMGIQSKENSETTIIVCCPPNGEMLEATALRDSAALDDYAYRIKEKIQEGKRVYVLDLLGANGGSAALARRLSFADALWGYCAWNTASNAMGTLLAQVLSDALRGEKNEAFFQERWLDDYVYQTHIRAMLSQELSARGQDIYSLENRQEADRLLAQLYQKHLPALWPLKELPAYSVRLPWPRTFEVLAQMET